MIYLLLTIQSVITAATPWLTSAAVVFALMAVGARLIERGSRCEAVAQFKRLGLQSALGGWGGTSEMGWGFSTQGYYANGTPPFYQSVYNPIDPDNPVIVRTVQYGADAALAASSEQLRVDPVFNHEPPEVFSSNLRAGDIDVLLARGLPALSGPAGSSPLSKLPADNNNDLNGKATPNSWPRQGAESWNGWRHSDIKAVALPFMFSVFQSFHQADNEQ